jgi:SWI/SNF-related matrix-associated actin-dependent regulator 1 of chromatin subfamily A
MNNDKREEGESLFQAKKARFMVATQSAGGRGRTWTAGNLVIYYSNNYSLELREQSEDRTHRIGQTGTVLYVDLVATGTVDENIITSLRQSKSIVRAVLEDGIERWI